MSTKVHYIFRYLIFALATLGVLFIFLKLNARPYVFVEISSEPQANRVVQLFYAEVADDFSEDKSVVKKKSANNFSKKYKFYIDENDFFSIKYLRIDPCNCEGEFTLLSWGIGRGAAIPLIGNEESFDVFHLYPANQLLILENVYISSGTDPQLKSKYLDFQKIQQNPSASQRLTTITFYGLVSLFLVLILFNSRKFLKKRNLRIFIFVFPLAYTALIVIGIFRGWPFIDAFIRQEGPGEALQAQLFLIAAVGALLIFIKIPTENNLIKYLHLILAISFFVIMLEEISYGQRIFQWDTPDRLAEVNWQSETTLHNIAGPIHIHDLFKIVGLYGAFSWLLCEIKLLKNLKILPFIVVPKIASLYFFSVFLFYFLFDLGSYRYGVIAQIPNIQEAFEMLLAAGFLIFIIRNFNLLFKIEIVDKSLNNKIT